VSIVQFCASLANKEIYNFANSFCNEELPRYTEAQEERAILWQILATLSDLEQACGDVEVAKKLRDHAREVIDDIAAHAGEIRDVFLGQPAVVQLIEK
jgi:uncharacterized protein YjaG (DUF416 family)